MLTFCIDVCLNFATLTRYFGEVSGISVSALNKISCLNNDTSAFMI